MSAWELLLIAVGLSMDAFAVAISAGLTMSRVTVGKALTVGLYFGAFQGLMPLLGYALATRFANSIMTYDHWIAFILLSLIGGKMIMESRPGVGGKDKKPQQAGEVSLSPGKMLPLAIATSIDAMAVGVSMAFLQVDIIPAVSFIGITTLLLSMLGVGVGHVFGARFQAKAGLAGGLILVLIGLKILLEHTGIIFF